MSFEKAKAIKANKMINPIRIMVPISLAEGAVWVPRDTWVRFQYYFLRKGAGLDTKGCERRLRGKEKGRGGYKLSNLSGVMGAFWVHPGCPSG